MADLFALSFMQPWLWAILACHKGATYDGTFYALENRTGKPPRGRVAPCTGRIALHASAGYDHDGLSFILRTLAPEASRVGLLAAPRGAIVGTATIAGAFQWPDGVRAEVVGPLVDAQVDVLAASRWAFGPWVWVLRDVRRLREPIPCKGALGFWRVPSDVARFVREWEVA